MWACSKLARHKFLWHFTTDPIYNFYIRGGKACPHENVDMLCNSFIKGPIMKEIKFRAWHKKENRMIPYERIVSIFFVGSNGINEKLEDGIRYRFYERNEIELNQYSGFKDYEGKDIYEEDYVEAFMPEYNKRIIGLVTWDRGLCIKDVANEIDINDEAQFYTDGIMNFNWQELRVVGNRYQNKV
jgi:uncharacterized phage protein (TIGR01671 family)